MASTLAFQRLDAYAQTRLDLWRTASIELSIGPASTDGLVQDGFDAGLAWLRGEAATPQALLDLYGQPHGPLGHQLGLVESLLDAGRAQAPIEPAPAVVPGHGNVSTSGRRGRRFWPTVSPLVAKQVPEPGSLS